MEIWQWVWQTQEELYEQGHERLADLIMDVPRAVVDLQHERVDALVPEAIHLARELGHAWLEIFFRHWNLQSQVFMRNNVEAALPEAVALIDFAHRDETRACPQSVCVVQDLSHCYGRLDGPGYVEERLAIAGETLARIDPDWNCFTCIAEEQADALLDAERYEDALNFIEEQVRALTRAGYRSKRYNLRKQEVEALLKLGRYEDAATLNNKARNAMQGESDALGRRLDGARIHAYRGKYTASKKALPSFNEIGATSSLYRNWAETVSMLARHGAIENDLQLDSLLHTLTQTLTTQGANYIAALIGLWRVELALLRDDAGLAATICDGVESISSRLRRPEVIMQRLITLRQQTTSY